MQPHDLISSARKLLGESQVGSPRQSDLKRAQSTAYYAMFHALCRNCANALVGKVKAHRSERAWIQAYRAMGHGHAKNQCKNSNVMNEFPEDIQDFASKFVELQLKREKADYDPSLILKRHDVITVIDAADAAITKLEKTNIKHQRAFAVWTVMNVRPD